jgi:hypothetical protein
MTQDKYTNYSKEVIAIEITKYLNLKDHRDLLVQHPNFTDLKKIRNWEVYSFCKVKNLLSWKSWNSNYKIQ